MFREGDKNDRTQKCIANIMNYVTRLQQGTRQKQKKFCSLFASGERKAGRASDKIKGIDMCCAAKRSANTKKYRGGGIIET